MDVLFKVLIPLGDKSSPGGQDFVTWREGKESWHYLGGIEIYQKKEDNV